MELNKQQKKHLKRLGHALRPVVMLGQHGLSEAVVNETISALEIHELIKVQVGGADKTERQTIVTQICEQTGATAVNLIGKQAIFYKPSSKQRILLPK